MVMRMRMRTIATVLLAPLVYHIRKRTVSVALERQEKVVLGGRRGGWAYELASHDDGRHTNRTRTVTTVPVVAVGGETAVSLVATALDGGKWTLSPLDAREGVTLDSFCAGDVIPGQIEGPEKSSSPLEARRMVLRGDGSDPAMTAGLVMVYTEDVAPLKGIDIVAAVLEALKKSVVTVVHEIGGNREIGSGGEQTATLATTEMVLVVSPSAPAAVDTAAKELGVEQKSRRCF
ncbi:hypothetical protein ARMSODRAFT_1090881 [Armillaria solidipes]|uniref:Uncharacterized protein n=1 Tax=Armillaria solidipes TaxID=1076256 RepID=A0A2H3AK79_9AGAR|nr:hypothetical protein ARMSODRAFT_1090881 [Armillaria solidipes]